MNNKNDNMAQDYTTWNMVLFTADDIFIVIKLLHNWISTGQGGVHNFWVKKLQSKHDNNDKREDSYLHNTYQRIKIIRGSFEV